MEKFLSVRDLSKVTGWSPLTIYKKSSAGQIPGRVKLGASLRFAESKINRWLRDAQKKSSTAQAERVDNIA
jgi:predicted DNA-binding transcriptional regulator AlpA